MKAARIARDPQNWETVNGITPEERKARRRESHLGFWSQPKTLRVTIIVLCFAAIVQGWTQTGANGANLSWPREFGLTTVDKAGDEVIRPGKDTWIFAGVNAITYLTASMGGCWFSDPLQSRILGRRGAIFASACLILASVIGAGCARSRWQLFGCRAILGLGMGAKASATPIFGAEASPPHLR